METYKIILLIIALPIFAYLGMSAFYLFVFALAGLRKKSNKIVKDDSLNHIVVLIPGYKEDAVIINTAKESLKQVYPNSHYDVVVIADSFEPETLSQLRELPIRVEEVSFEKSTKAKALKTVLQRLEKQYDLALILDADNIMEADFLTKINGRFNEGSRVIQGHRTAKNTDTPFAILDAISEEINNNIYNLGHLNLRMSARLVGSGMAFEYELFKEMIMKNEAVGGFDKELELELLKDGHYIDYMHDALVLDEKVASQEVFGNQRKRWISSQFHYFRKYFMSGVIALFTKGNFDFFNKCFQMMLPPRLLLPGVLLFIAIGGFLLAPINIAIICAIPFVLNAIAYGISIPVKFYNKNTIKAFMQLPKAFFITFSLLFKMKKANETFIHTPHSNPVNYEQK